MRLVRAILAVSCLLGGCCLLLRALGLLATAMHGLSHWWPASLWIIGVAILARSMRPGPHSTRSSRPGPHSVVAVLFILAGDIGFAVTRGVINVRVWIFAAAAGLIAVGTMFAWASIAAPPKYAARSAPMVFVLFRAADVTLELAELDRVGVFLVFGHLELHLEQAVKNMRKNARNRNTIIVEITSLIGTVRISVPDDTDIHKHEAFVKKFRQPLSVGMLDQDRCDEADVVASSISLFGDTEFTKTEPPNPAREPSGISPEPDDRIPASQ